MRARARYAVVLGAALVAILTAWALSSPALLRTVLVSVAGFTTGYRISLEDLRLSPSRITAVGVRVTRAGEPVLDAARVEVAYSLHDLLRGGAHRFGLERVTVVAPRFTLIRHRDGSLNFVLPSGGGPPPETGSPWAFDATLRDGTIEIRDPYNPSPSARDLQVAGINADARVRSAGRSTYRLRAALLSPQAPGGRDPLTAEGTVDVASGYAVHRIRAAALPVTGFIDYIIDSKSARFLAGSVRDLDVRFVSLGIAGTRPAPYHLMGTMRVEGIAARVVGLDQPVRDLHGDLTVADDGIMAPHLAASINGTPIAIGGGFYDFAHPQFRIGVRGAADLDAMRGLFPFLRHEPVAGPVRFTTLIEGGVAKPAIFAHVALPHARWGNFPFDHGSGTVAYYDDAVTMLPLEAHYGPLRVSVSGGLALSQHIDSEFAVRLAGAGRALPYLDRIAPDLPLQGVAVAAGRDLPIHARGILYGDGPQTALSGFVAIDERGRGEFGPFDFERRDGELSGGFVQDRPASQGAFWISLRDYRIVDPVRPATLPGVTLPEFPHLGGTIDAAFAGGGAPSNLTFAGRASGRDLEFAGIPVSHGAVTFGGTFHELRLGAIAASGPWGRMTGVGAVALPGAFVLRGAYQGSLESLRRFTGDLGAQGGVTGPFGVAVDGDRIVVQTSGVRLDAATIHGVPLSSFAGTLAIEPGGGLDILGAEAGIAGTRAVAAGSAGGGIAVATGAIPLAGLHEGGLRFGGGAVRAAGTATVAGGLPTFDGGVALSDGRFGPHRFAATSELGFAQGRLRLADATGIADGAPAFAQGTVGGLPGTPSYAFHVVVPAARLGPLASTFPVRFPYFDGSLQADVAIAGTGLRPRIDGTVAVPDGTINGLAFGDGTLRVDGTPDALVARDGSVAVGSTRITFAGAYGRDVLGLRVSGDAVNLADFDDYFDAGDQLAGTGKIALVFGGRRGRTRTRGDVALSGVRYGAFPLGRLDARWASHDGTVALAFGSGGTEGSLALGGTVRLASGTPLRALRGAAYDLDAHLDGLDVRSLLPRLGYDYPLAGALGGSATIHGTLRRPQIDASLALTDGAIGSVPIREASVHAQVADGVATIAGLNLALDHLTVSGSGRIGIAPASPVSLDVTAASDDVGILARSLHALPIALGGAATSQLRVSGTRAAPAISGTFAFDGGRIGGLAVPHAAGGFALRGQSVSLDPTEVDLAHGSVVVSGSLPIALAPFGVSPPSAPVALDVNVPHVDLSDFVQLLPKGAILSGTLAGRFGLTGTVGDPRLFGSLGLTGGALGLAGMTKLTNVHGAVSLAARTVTLDSLHAGVGSGSVDLDGRIAFPGASGLDYAFDATAHHADVTLPGYFSGVLDGAVRLAQTPARPVLSGAVTVTDSTVPFGAIFAGGGAVGSAPGFVSDLGLDLSITAGKNVRVRSGAIDVGGEGTIALRGSIGAPRLSGSFQASPGGTLVYFNRVFRVIEGTVSFQPTAGSVPTMDAVAETHVANTDPDPARNPSGTADITIQVSGPVTGLSVGLSSNPPYDREQILGLLLGASSLGAVNFGTAGAPTTVGGTLQGAPQVSIGGLPPGLVQEQNGTLTVSQQAFGLLNAQFTRALLSPIENVVGGALGLTTFDLTVDYGGSVGFSARKALAKNIYAVYGQSFTYPIRQTYGFEAAPNPSLSMLFAAYSQQGLAPLGVNPQAVISTNQGATAGQPPSGESGFTFSVQRRYP